MEADFLREYEIDINDRDWQDSTSFRKFCVLIKGLSPDSAFARFVSEESNYNLAKFGGQ